MDYEFKGGKVIFKSGDDGNIIYNQVHKSRFFKVYYNKKLNHYIMFNNLQCFLGDINYEKWGRKNKWCFSMDEDIRFNIECLEHLLGFMNKLKEN